MADSNENTDGQTSTTTTTKTTFWRSRISGLKIILGPPLNGETQPPYLQFTPFEERWDGDLIKVGYLETDNADAIARLKDDPECEKITKDEYDEKTNLENPKVKRLPL